MPAKKILHNRWLWWLRNLEGLPLTPLALRRYLAATGLKMDYEALQDIVYIWLPPRCSFKIY